MAAKTLEPAAYQFIRRYQDLIGLTPAPEQTLLLKYLNEAGNELPVANNRAWFYAAWRKGDVMGNGHKDMIVWHLLHFDPVIDTVVMELLPEEDPYAF